MKLLKKIAIVLLTFTLLVLLLDLGLNYWIAKELPGLINKKNDSPYTITYENLEISLLDRTIIAQNIYLYPKAATENTPIKAGVYAKIKTVHVKQFEFWKLLFSDKIKAKSITIIKPEITVFKRNENAVNNSGSIRSQIVAPFNKVIFVSDIYLNEGDLKIVYTQNKKAILAVANISVKLEQIAITDDILKKNIPFSYRNYAFSCDSIYYRPNKFYHIRTKHIETTEKGLSIQRFEMIPEYSRAEFVRRLPAEKDMYTLKARAVKINNMKWGFDKTEKIFFHTESVVIDNINANIYRGKMPPDDLKKKPLFNKLLREIPFDLKIDTLKINSSYLEYEEEKTFEKGAGLLSFNHLNLTARNISSGFYKQKRCDVALHINCRFMNVSPMKVDWSFNVQDKADGFRIKGSIQKFPAENLTPFIKSYMNITAKGMLDEVYFDFEGNDKKAIGSFAVNYDDLKFTVYQKDDVKKKNRLITFITRIFVKKTTKEKIKNTPIEVERIPEKSFFNFLWRCIADGLKKLLI